MSYEEHKETEIEDVVNEELEKSIKVKCDRKCMHQGDRVCYNNAKEIITKIPKEESVTDTSRSGDTDSVQSGESAFKTFHFDTEDDDPDMEKCMVFWKNILEKNIKPMKCTLLKPKKVKETVPKKKKDADTCEKEETKKLWMDVYKELQRRRLDKIKLGKQKICDPCADFFDDEYEKKQDSEDIKKLNQWTSHHQPAKLDVKAQVKRTLQVLKAARAGPSTEEKLVDTKNKQLPEKTDRASVEKDKATIKSSITGGVTESKQKIQQSDTKKSVTEQPQNSVVAEKSSVLSEAISQKTALSSSKISDGLAHEILKTPQPPRTDSSQENVDKPTKVVEELRQSVNEKSESVIQENESDICCKCGCEIDQCICGDMANLGIEVETMKKSPCMPCECQSICVCGEDIQDTNICSCGCLVDECECEKNDTCKCGCGLEECICDNICLCGCGLEECICQQLFTNMCKCGDLTCDCDMIEILSTYLDSVCTPTKSQTGLVSTESQTDDQSKLWEKPPKQGGYCIICGHFNCYCNRENSQYCDD